MSIFFRLALVACLIGIGPVAAQSEDPSLSGWVKVCIADGACTVHTAVAVPDGLVRVLVHTPVGKAPILQVLLPPGVPEGSMFTWVIPGRADYSYAVGDCDAERCRTLGELGEAGVSEMKRGNLVRIGYGLSDGRRFTADLTLKGFTAAFDGSPTEMTTAQIEAELQMRAEALRQQLDQAGDAGTEPEAGPTELAEGTPVLADWIRGCIPNGAAAAPLCGTTAYLFVGGAARATVSVLDAEGATPASLSVNLIGSDVVADAGFVLQIDQHVAVSFPIQKCDPAGFCTTRAKIPENWIAWLKEGAALTISFMGSAKVEGSIPISGFAAAVDGPMASDDEVRAWRRAIVERGMQS